jgi:hypothetical protein
MVHDRPGEVQAMTPNQLESVGGYLTAERPKRNQVDLLRTLLTLTRGAVERYDTLHPEVRTEVLIALDMADAAIARQR